MSSDAGTDDHRVFRDADGTIVFEPRGGAPPAGALVFSHGLGDSGDGWLDAAVSVFSPALPRARIYLPSAPEQPVTVNDGAEMPSWFDIASLDRSRANQPCTGIDASVARVGRLLDAAERAGAPRGAAVLAGFSQGGALSLYSALTLGRPLAGVAVLSGYLPRSDALAAARRAPPTTAGARAQRSVAAAEGPAAAAAAAAAGADAPPPQTPIRMYHGNGDDVVHHTWAVESVEALKGLGVTDVELKTYRGLPHSASPAELRDVAAFLAQCLPAAAARPE